MAPISIWLANDRFIHQNQNIFKQYPAMAANSISSHSKMWFEEASISPRESSESHGVASPPKSQPSPHPVPSEICFLSGVVTQRGEIYDFLGWRGHKAHLVRGQTRVWIMLSGRLGSQCFGWWRTVGKRPPPSLACLLAWMKINKSGTLRLTKLCLTVKDPTWRSSMCNNSYNLVAFFITSLVLVSTKFLLGPSWRILQPSPQLLEHTLEKKNKLWIGFSHAVTIRGCWSSEPIQMQLSLGLFIPCWCVCRARGITELAETKICLPQKVQVHLLFSVEANLISLSSPA